MRHLEGWRYKLWRRGGKPSGECTTLLELKSRSRFISIARLSGIRPIDVPHGTTLKLTLFCAEGCRALGRHLKFLLLARKLCKEGKSIDERAFRREAGSLFHILINTCVQNLMRAKYLARLSEEIVQ